MVAVVVPVEAADEPENVIKYRRIVMQSHGTHLRPIAMIINGEVSFSGHIVAHARAAHAVSLMLADLFPKGTDVGDTRAKPEIWQKTAQFQAAIEALKTATAELVRVAEAGDMTAIGAQLEEVGKACGGCHKPFRKEKQ
jgi:cytochrome c556